MLPSNTRRKSKIIYRLKVAGVIALLFCAYGFVGHMDVQDAQLKAEVSGTK